jgi:hypothetical protein
MSVLEALIEDLRVVINSSINDSEILNQIAAHCREAAANLQSDLVGTQNPRAKETVSLLFLCADSCFRAAESCREAARIGTSWAGNVAGRQFYGSNADSPSHSSSAPRTESEADRLPLLSREGLRAVAGGINPGYDQNLENPRRINCGSCALSLFRTLNGIPTIAEERTLSTKEMEASTGLKQIAMSPQEIRDRLKALGPGSHTVVGVDRKGWSGHWFNAYFDGEKVVAVDGQNGSITDWPPDYGSNDHPVVLWDAAF